MMSLKLYLCISNSPERFYESCQAQYGIQAAEIHQDYKQFKKKEIANTKPNRNRLHSTCTTHAHTTANIALRVCRGKDIPHKYDSKSCVLQGCRHGHGSKRLGTSLKPCVDNTGQTYSVCDFTVLTIYVYSPDKFMTIFHRIRNIIIHSTGSH